MKSWILFSVSSSPFVPAHCTTECFIFELSTALAHYTFFNNEIQAAIRDRDLQELFLVKIYFLGLKKSHLSSNFLAEIVELVFENLTTNCGLNFCYVYKIQMEVSDFPLDVFHALILNLVPEEAA